MKIEKAIKMMTFKGFYAALKREKRKGRSVWAAFEKLNAEYERHFGKKRYKNWKSFNAVLNRKIRQENPKVRRKQQQKKSQLYR